MNGNIAKKAARHVVQPFRIYLDRHFESTLRSCLNCRHSGIFELKSWDNEDIRANVLKCVALQKQAASSVIRDQYRPHPAAKEFVSKRSLEKIQLEGKAVNKVSKDAESSNLIAFRHKQSGKHPIFDNEVIQAREQLKEAVSKSILLLCGGNKNFNLFMSGHFWYPPGGFMAWHTNNDKPGWRVYLSYAEEEGRSFFRYRDPSNGSITTSYDTGFDLRMFLVSRQRPFWHAVYSKTNRFSFGFSLRRAPLLQRLR